VSKAGLVDFEIGGRLTSSSSEESLRGLGQGLKKDWRLLMLVVSVILLLVAYALPMFPNRIVQATTRFSGGTLHVSHFAVLISGQHLIQGDHPIGETLSGVSIVTAPVPGVAASGWGWLATILTRKGALGQHLSFVICLLVPIGAALVALSLVWWGSKRNELPSFWIPVLIDLAALAIPALFLAWLHQFDFSGILFALDRAALMPAVGFWLALLACVVLLLASFALKRETHRQIINWWALVLVVSVSVWLLTRFKPYPFLEIWRFISDGIVVTLRIVTTSFGFILLVSLIGGLGRISRNPLIRGIASLYVELIRGIPLLVQLLFIWFALPQIFDVFGNLLIAVSPSLDKVGQWLIDLRLNPFTAAVLGLTVCYGAYGSEIFRAGISSIHHGQMEAARSLGMNYFQAMRYVILPQAIRVILPPVGNEFVALLKDSSLVSVLAVSDLTRRGREYMARTFLSFDTWIMVALCYLVLTLFSSRVVEFIEAKTSFE